MFLFFLKIINLSERPNFFQTLILFSEMRCITYIFWFSFVFIWYMYLNFDTWFRYLISWRVVSHLDYRYPKFVRIFWKQLMIHVFPVSICTLIPWIVGGEKLKKFGGIYLTLENQVVSQCSCVCEKLVYVQFKLLTKKKKKKFKLKIVTQLS